MRNLKILTSNLEARIDVSIQSYEKVVIKGERAFIVPKNYNNIDDIENDLEIEAPYQLEGNFESFVIE